MSKVSVGKAIAVFIVAILGTALLFQTVFASSFFAGVAENAKVVMSAQEKGVSGETPVTLIVKEEENSMSGQTPVTLVVTDPLVKTTPVSVIVKEKENTMSGQTPVSVIVK